MGSTGVPSPLGSGGGGSLRRSPTAAGCEDTVRSPRVSGAQAGGWRPPQMWDGCAHTSHLTQDLALLRPFSHPLLPKSPRPPASVGETEAQRRE